MIFAADVLSLHYNPEYWGPVSPYEFYPQRFEQKRDTLAYLPFGLGPRICVGMRFALLELKLTLIKLLLRYDVIATENTEKLIEFEEGIVRRPKNGVKVLFRKRAIRE